MTENKQVSINSKDPTYKAIVDKFCDIETNTPLDKRVAVGFYYAMNVLFNLPTGQPKHIQPDEQDFIHDLKTQGFSIGDIALICDRSKSTIFEALNKTNTKQAETIPVIMA